MIASIHMSRSWKAELSVRMCKPCSACKAKTLACSGCFVCLLLRSIHTGAILCISLDFVSCSHLPVQLCYWISAKNSAECCLAFNLNTPSDTTNNTELESGLCHYSKFASIDMVHRWESSQVLSINHTTQMCVHQMIHTNQERIKFWIYFILISCSIPWRCH